MDLLKDTMTFINLGTIKTVPNTGLAKVAVQCSVDTFVVNQTLVLRINICGENRHLRQAQNRSSQ
jgi:hypothetical protein